ncbi:MAG: porin [Alphaproteobacteria bacterium]
MKKVFLSVILSVLLTGITPAIAEIETKVGGFVKFQYGFFDHKTKNVVQNNKTSNDSLVDSDIYIRAHQTADNGLEYGAQVDLKASRNNTETSQNVFVYSQGAFGRVELGDTPGAANELTVRAPTVGIGQIDSKLYRWNLPTALLVPNNFDDDYSTKLSYYTPSFSGVRLGLSYMPQLGSAGEEVIFSQVQQSVAQPRSIDQPNALQSIVQAGVQYKETFGKVNSITGGSYVMGDGKKRLAAPTFYYNNARSWALGTQLGIGPFSVGGGYLHSGNSLSYQNLTGLNEYNLGASYSNGPWAIGVSFVQQNADQADTMLYGGGVNYTLYEGWTLGADLMFYDVSGKLGNPDKDGYLVLTETAVTF